MTFPISLGVILQLVLILIFLGIFNKSYSKILNYKKRHGAPKTENYMGLVLTGAVSGIVVLVLDRTIVPFFENISKIPLTSWKVFFESLGGLIIYAILVASAILGLTFWIISVGLPKNKK